MVGKPCGIVWVLVDEERGRLKAPSLLEEFLRRLAQKTTSVCLAPVTQGCFDHVATLLKDWHEEPVMVSDVLVACRSDRRAGCAVYIVAPDWLQYSDPTRFLSSLAHRFDVIALYSFPVQAARYLSGDGQVDSVIILSGESSVAIESATDTLVDLKELSEPTVTEWVLLYSLRPNLGEERLEKLSSWARAWSVQLRVLVESLSSTPNELLDRKGDDDVTVAAAIEPVAWWRRIPELWRALFVEVWEGRVSWVGTNRSWRGREWLLRLECRPDHTLRLKRSKDQLIARHLEAGRWVRVWVPRFGGDVKAVLGLDASKRR